MEVHKYEMRTDREESRPSPNLQKHVPGQFVYTIYTVFSARLGVKSPPSSWIDRKIVKNV